MYQEPGLGEMLEQELDQRVNAREKLQAEVKRYVDLMEYKSMLMEADRSGVWHSYLKEDNNQNFITRFESLKNQAGDARHDMLVAEMSRRQAERDERFGYTASRTPNQPPPGYPASGDLGYWAEFNQE